VRDIKPGIAAERRSSALRAVAASLARETRSTEERAMQFRTLAIAAAMTALLGAPVAFASETTAPAAQAATSEQAPPPTVQQIVEQQTKLRADVAAKKGAFKDLSDSERESLMKTQTRVLQLLESTDNIEQLDINQKIEVFNHLEWISATVRQAEEDRQVCERSRVVGTNRFKVVCMTAKQQREYKERSRQSLRTALKCQGTDTLGCKDELGGAELRNGRLGGGQKVGELEKIASF
jgi:hypothetical protein